MAVYIAAVAAVIVYCIAVMSVGVWSGRKLHEDNSHPTATEDLKHAFRRHSHAVQGNFVQKLFLAEGRLSVTLGIFSMTGEPPQHDHNTRHKGPTWVGGGYLNGTAEVAYTSGILYCFAPIGYALSLVLGGAFFAKKMRKTRAVTMLDPLQRHYGRWMGVLLCLPAVCAEIFWTATMLAALGDAAGTIMQWICVPYAAKSSAVNTLRPPHNDWVGHIPSRDIMRIVDGFLVTALGGIPWQVYFQRVLGSDSDFTAKMLSYAAAIGCLFLALPPAILGGMAKTTNFTAAGYSGPATLRNQDRSRVLPFSIRYLTSPTLSVLGMIGILAAVMSSVDSSMLSASAMVTWNVYHALMRPEASEKEVALTLRLTVCAIGASATYLALSVKSVFNLWILCSDVVYVLLFPQLVCVFYIKHTNAYGSVSAFFLGAISRWLIGEPSFALTASAHTASYESDWRHRFPYGLACMTLSMTTLIAASLLVTVAFEHRWLSLRYDVFHCFSDARSAGTRHVDVTVGLGTNEALVAREALAVDKGNDKANDKSNDKVNDKGNGGSDGRIKAAVDGECERTKSGHRDKVYSRKPSKGTGGTDSAGVTESERTPSVAAISALPAGAARTVPEVAAKPARRTSTK
ncbi:hypothetical protein HPB52_015660 [Rhipicephalus sanguineus]|uniref:High-affinity choline transporter 1 n=1 Tax=Rhipicephalus sanguineus TaxID=34632 RepID=A0A9D4SX54_RHISA|nr:hypothetical protein HPB52_015660 [Rhipicephalus sanguineus]